MAPILRSAGVMCVCIAASTAGCHAPTLSTSPAITAEDAAAIMERLAHDSLRGRMSGGAELRSAAAWIASEFERIGLSAGAAEGYVRTFGLERRRIDTANVAIHAGTVGEPIRWSDGLAVGLTSPSSAAGTLLIEHPDSLAVGAVWERRIVLLPLAVASEGDHADLGQRAIRLARDRRAAALVLGYTASDGDSAVHERARTFAFSGPVYAGPDESEPVLMWAGPEAAGRLAAFGDGTTVELRTPRIVVDPGLTPNVVGIIRGAGDRNGAILITAHLDAQGTTSRAGWESGVLSMDESGADSIFNGADDNASGVSALLEVAESIAADSLEYRRSIIFLATGGEEAGLLGARHFLRTSPHADDIAAVINLDMIGRNHPGRIHVIGGTRSALGSIASDAVRAAGELEVEAMSAADEEALFGRSDHAPFAEVGIPAVWLFAGLHPDYHTVHDEAVHVNAEKVARVARAVAELVRRLAQEPRLQ